MLFYPPQWVSVDYEKEEKIEKEERNRSAREKEDNVFSQIVQVTGWVIKPDGKVSLTATNPNSITSSPSMKHPHCNTGL